MATLNVRTDELLETALRELAAEHGSRSDAVRYAVLHTYRESLLKRARDDAERLAADPDDQAEMLAIQRFMGVAE
jgi:Arc/MetJ-type ribon-helix-helix transcriptional regulator